MSNGTDTPVVVDYDGPEPTPEDLFGAMSAALGAATMAMQYTAAALIVAAAERDAIDPARVFALLKVLADGFDRGVAAAGPTGKLSALMLRTIKPTYENLIKIPPGAGRA